MRFDYLHSARPLIIQRMLEIRIPERFHSALFALFGSIALIGGACGIDAYRLGHALHVQAVYRQRYEQTASALQRTNVYYEHVRELVALDRRVRRIALSGDMDARTLAEIANELPPHAWLTGISHDPTGLSLNGRAKNLAVLSSVMQGLMRAKHLRRPRLVNALLDTPRGRGRSMRYEIHVDGVAR